MALVDVVMSHPGGRGWGPVEKLAVLAAEELRAEVHYGVADVDYTRRSLVRGLIPPPRRGHSDRVALVIAPQPAHLNAILQNALWRRSYGLVLGWVIDSFWIDRVPRIARSSGYFDHIFVTDPDDVTPWQAQTRASVSALPWGADVLGMPFETERAVDLQRIGRQPEAWDDDAATAVAAANYGIRFSGRPPFGDSDEDSAALARRAASNAKFILAFSNLAHRSPYTHTEREYVTGRWLDALAAGATVVGAVPKTRVAEDLFWDGACIDLPSTKMEDGLPVIRDALRAWSPDHALRNRRHALERLDWRYRLKVIADLAHLETPHLDESLDQLGKAIDVARQAEGGR